MTSRGADPTEMWGAFATPPELGWALPIAFRNSSPLGEPLPSWVEQRCSLEAAGSADTGDSLVRFCSVRATHRLTKGDARLNYL